MSIQKEDGVIIFPGFQYAFPPQGAAPSTDSYVLAWFASSRRLGRCLDLCSGAGMLSYLLLARGAASACDCLDISPEAVACCEKNRLQLVNVQAVRAFQGDGGDCQRIFRDVVFDSCVCNPPYHTEATGASAARTAAADELQRIVSSAAAVVKNGGRLFFSMRASRMEDLLCAFRNAGVAPKRLLIAAHSVGKKPFSVFCEGIKGAASGLDILPVLYLSNADGTPTAESRQIYYEGWQASFMRSAVQP